MAPTRGLHTNPICVGVPAGADHRPFVLDFATSQIAMGKMRVAHNERRKMAPGTLIDSRGAPTTDPAVLFGEPFGSILPFGGHKGSGLAVMCELLGAQRWSDEPVDRAPPRRSHHWLTAFR